jgi:ABC-type phosphate transport system substrate-binding protein
MIMNKLIIETISIVLLMFFSSLLNASTVVIVNSANPDSSITKKIAKKIFMGKTSSTGGAEVVPVDQEENSTVRNNFYLKAANKAADKMKSYWSKMIFSGKAVPPEVVKGDAAVIAWVSSHKDAIGYVDSGAVSSSVKVVLELP